MPETLTGTDTGSFVNAVTAPVAGDLVTGASIQVGLQGVQNNLAHEDAAKVERKGDTMTGPLVVSPTTAAGPAVTGTGVGGQPGGAFQGGVTAVAGLEGTAGTGSGGEGVSGIGDGAGPGVKGRGGSTSGTPGVEGNGSGSSGTGVQGTGSGTGPGGLFTGGASGEGLQGNAGTGSNAAGVTGVADGTGAGGSFQGGGSGPGVNGFGQGSAPGGQFIGTGTGPGLTATPGGTSPAIVANGPIELVSAELASNATDPGKNFLWSILSPKAVAPIALSGSGGFSIAAGRAANIASVSFTDPGVGHFSSITVTLAHAMADENYVVIPIWSPAGGGPAQVVTPLITGNAAFKLVIYEGISGVGSSTTPAPIDTLAGTIMLLVFGEE